MLRYAFFQHFKGAPTLLFWGGPDDVALLFEALTQKADGEGPESLADIPGTVSVDGSSVLLETLGEAEGLARDTVEPDVFHWRMDQNGWYEFAELVEPLTGRIPCHQFLLSGTGDDITVLVSAGEYPDDLTPSG